jgi:hypothetical protein
VIEKEVDLVHHGGQDRGGGDFISGKGKSAEMGSF